MFNMGIVGKKSSNLFIYTRYFRLDGPNMILTFDRKRLVYYNAVQNQSPYEPLMDAEGMLPSRIAFLTIPILLKVDHVP